VTFEFGEDMTEAIGTTTPPKAEASDDPEVAVLLKAATALWEDGDPNGAVRWYARAAEAAGDVGDDRRALELARAVADLKDKLGAAEGPRPSTTRPPPSKMPPPPSARKPSLPPKPPLRQRSIPPALPQAAATATLPSNGSEAVDAAERNGEPSHTPSPSPHDGQAGATGVRVSVKTSIRDPDLIIVRVLKKGQAAPSGCGEGVLAPTGRGFDLGNLRG
jgi:hypothetical protein